MSDVMESPAETTRQRKPRTKPVIDAEAIVAATHVPDYGIGDVVLYRPADEALRSLRSNRGLAAEDFAAIVTFVHDNGNVSLKVFRPLGFGDVPVLECAYSATPKPNTFRMKVAKG